MNTTLNAIREHSPCADGWAKLLRHLGKTQADDDPLPILTVLESNGIDDALWALRAGRARPRNSVVFRMVRAPSAALMSDYRSVEALNVAERFANGEVSDVGAAARGHGLLQAAAGDVARESAGAAARPQGAAHGLPQEATWAARGCRTGCCTGCCMGCRMGLHGLLHGLSHGMRKSRSCRDVRGSSMSHAYAAPGATFCRHSPAIHPHVSENNSDDATGNHRRRALLAQPRPRRGAQRRSAQARLSLSRRGQTMIDGFWSRCRERRRRNPVAAAISTVGGNGK